MSQATLIKPDREFAEKIIRLGGKNVKQCYQCATCSVTCELSTDENPFPRKEMIWASWGLKERLYGDPDVWLCHRCADCSKHCPRGAVPGDVMAAIRDASVEHFAFPQFLGKAFNRPMLAPLLLAVPAVLMLIILAAGGNLRIPDVHPVEYGEFFPHIPLQLFFGGFVGLALVAAVVGARRFWIAMKTQSPPKGQTVDLKTSIVETVKDIALHRKFKVCKEDKGRYLSHLLTFYGFVGLFITTVGAVAALYIFEYYPLPFLHPLKIFGNLSTIAMLAGLTLMIRDRRRKAERVEGTVANDWTFIGLLYALVVTGVFVEGFRYANVAVAAYPMYFVHLMLVFATLAYLPYSRFAHLIYRTVALVYTRYSGRHTVGS